MLEAPADLPDGDYVVTFDGHTLLTTRRYGLWFSSTDITYSSRGICRFRLASQRD